MERGNLVIRVFHAWIKQGKEGEYERLVREQALPNLRSQPGLMNVHAGVIADRTPPEVVIVSVWKGVDAIKKFAGDQWQEPVISPGEAELVEKASVEHYQSIERPGDVM